MGMPELEIDSSNFHAGPNPMHHVIAPCQISAAVIPEIIRIRLTYLELDDQVEGNVKSCA